MKKHFNKELVLTKDDNQDFKNSSKCWIYDNDYNDNDVKRSLPYHWKIQKALHIEIVMSPLN